MIALGKRETGGIGPVLYDRFCLAYIQERKFSVLK
jgi:hypothetical protein